MSAALEAPRSAVSTPLIILKADFDGTLAHARHRHGVLRFLENSPLKAPFEPLPDVQEGLTTLIAEPDVVFMGVVTARNRFMRPQTPRQAWRVRPGMDITYTTGSYSEKITNLLDTAEKIGDSATVIRTVLIDDRPKQVIAAAHKVAEDSAQLERMRRAGITLVSFGLRPVEGAETLPDGAMQIIEMPDWSRGSVQHVLSRLREPVR